MQRSGLLHRAAFEMVEQSGASRSGRCRRIAVRCGDRHSDDRKRPSPPARTRVKPTLLQGSPVGHRCPNGGESSHIQPHPRGETLRFLALLDGFESLLLHFHSPRSRTVATRRRPRCARVSELRLHLHRVPVAIDLRELDRVRFRGVDEAAVVLPKRSRIVPLAVVSLLATCGTL